MRNIILILLLLCFSSVGFAEEYKGELVDVRSVHKTVLSGELYETDASNVHAGYKQLNGYPGQEKFLIYFSDKGPAITERIDIDLDEVIEWEYNGATLRNSRREIYGLFSDLRRSGSQSVRESWQYKTFGQVYVDWLQDVTIQQDVIRLVSGYKMFKRGERPYNRFTLANIKVDTRQTNNNTDLDGIK